MGLGVNKNSLVYLPPLSDKTIARKHCHQHGNEDSHTKSQAVLLDKIIVCGICVFLTIRTWKNNVDLFHQLLL